MIINMKKLISIVALSIFAVAILTAPLTNIASAAGSQDAVCESLGAVSGGSGCSDIAGDPTVDSAVNTALDILSLAAGIIAVIMIIIAGIKYVTSQGESGATSSAKNTILYAAIGIAVVVVAQTIVFFVFDRVK